MRLRSLLISILSICPIVTAKLNASRTPIVLDAALKSQIDDNPSWTYNIRIGHPSSPLDVRPNIYDQGVSVFSSGFHLPNGGSLNSPLVNLESFFGTTTWYNDARTRPQNFSEEASPVYFQDIAKGEHQGTWTAQDVPIRMLITSNNSAIGQIGLGVRYPLLKRNASEPKSLSLMERLWKTSQIPSLSWTYSEGTWVMKHNTTSERYRIWSNTAASLVLGGYDEEKCNYTSPETQRYPLEVGPTQTLDFEIPTMNLLLASKFNKTINLNYSTTDVAIDNTAPFTLLPQTVCDQISQLLDLKWDATSRLYLVSDMTIGNWLRSNATFTFEFRTGAMNPYVQAVDWLLHTKKPLSHSNTTYEWFLPIRPIVDDGRPLSAYTAILGRSFLRTACLTADFENKKLAIIPLNQTHAYQEYRTIVPIDPPAEPSKAPPKDSNLKTPNVLKIFLIALTSVLGATVFVSLGYICIKRSQKSDKNEDSKNEAKELEGGTLFEKDSGSVSEMDTLKSPIEMTSVDQPVELEASAVPELGGREIFVKR